MNRKQKIIVSVTGIFIVLLILVGLTYAYFLTRIQGNTNTKSISVTTANLELVYGDGTQTILKNDIALEPDSDNAIGTKDFTVTNKEGYGGEIQISTGIDVNGTVKGISILSISETAGLGMRAKEEDFQKQFREKTVDQFEYTKSGASADNQIDALSGATITTSAVTSNVNAALTYYQNVLGGGNTNE